MKNISENIASNSFLSRFKKEDKLLLIIIITIILIIILLLYLIEKIIFIILTKLTFTPLISFPLQIFLHLLLIRYLILEIAFSGQNKFISRSIFYNLGKMQACHLFDTFNLFLTVLLTFKVKAKDLIINLSDLYSLKRQLNAVNFLLNYHLDIFRKMKNKFNLLSIDQQLFFNNINYLKDAFNKGNFGNFINETIQTFETSGKKSLIELSDDEKDNIESKISVSNNGRVNGISSFFINLIYSFLDSFHKKDFISIRFSNFH